MNGNYDILRRNLGFIGKLRHQNIFRFIGINRVEISALLFFFAFLTKMS